MSKLLGVMTVEVDGKRLLVNRDCVINVGGARRNVVKGDTVHGYAEEPMEAFAETQVTVKPGDSLKEWGAISGATVTVKADTGQRFLLPNAWVEEPPQATGGEGGRVPLKFVSRRCEEL